VKHPRSYPDPQYHWQGNRITLYDARRPPVSARLIEDANEPGLYRVQGPNGGMSQEPLPRADAGRAAIAILRGAIAGTGAST
jgi:hypothetical protein